MRFELDDILNIEGPTEPDQYGCVSVLVSLRLFDEKGVQTEICCAGKSRKATSALAYALEGVAERLKTSKV